MTRTLDSTPAADGYRMPAEYEPHRGARWPGPSAWTTGGCRQARAAAFAAVAEAIQLSEPVTHDRLAEQIENCRAMLSPAIRCAS